MDSNTDESFKEYIAKVNIQELLRHAGYVNYRRDGLRYPSYVLLDNEGRRIHGSKFIVNPQTNTCYHPPVIKNYNVISFITEHPDIFPEKADNPYRLVHDVCRSILNMPRDYRDSAVLSPVNPHPFDIRDYRTTRFRRNDWESQKQFGPYFIHRGINLSTQSAFSRMFMLATRQTDSEQTWAHTHLSFPMHIPGRSGIVGFEQRGRPRLDGTSGYKGMARGSNASEGLWIANLSHGQLDRAKDIFWFESAYDAMAYYQLNSARPEVRNGVFVSTGGNPSVMQMRGMLSAVPGAVHHAAFDNDLAGKQFASNLQTNAQYVEANLNSGKENSPLKDLGTYDVPEWALCMLENGESVGLEDEELEVLDKFVSEHFPNGYVMDIDWDNPNEFNRYPSFGTKVEHPFGHGESPYLAVKTYPVRFLHPSLREGMTSIAVVREEPQDGTKDWNESLLRQIKDTQEHQQSSETDERKEAAGVDLDSDGEIEVSECEEKKHQAVHRLGR